MGPCQPWASQCHEAQKWGLIGLEVRQEEGVKVKIFLDCVSSFQSSFVHKWQQMQVNAY